MAISKHWWILVIFVVCAVVAAAIYVGTQQSQHSSPIGPHGKLIVNNLTTSDNYTDIS
jgi:hypothetical protein